MGGHVATIEREGTVKTKPILFSAPMVRALLNGSKTQTRRVVKPLKGEELDPDGVYDFYPGDIERERCPYGHEGDLLWVRETLECGEGTLDYAEGGDVCSYLETDKEAAVWDRYVKNEHGLCGGKIPSIFMPRWASRLTLEIDDVRVQRLKSISISDAIAEGIERTSANSFRSYLSGGHIVAPGIDTAAIASYFTLWESINGSESLAADPWVYAIKFKTHHCNVDHLLGKQAS